MRRGRTLTAALPMALPTALLLTVGFAGAAHAAPEDRWKDSPPALLEASITPLLPGIEPLETVEEDAEGTAIVLKADILFAFGSADLPEPARARIGELVAPIPQGAQVEVAGHTDAIGGEAANQALSEERAAAVAEAIGQARPDLQLTVVGYGESRPVAANSRAGEDDPEGRALNRRVEIRYDG